MYCDKCGQFIPAGSTYCSHCGHPVSGGEDIFSAQKGDFITLKCPNCGGNLEINTQGQTFKCPFCGFEHILRHDQNGFFLEAYARCPTCHRNDKVTQAKLLYGEISIPTLYLQPLALNHIILRTIALCVSAVVFFFLLKLLNSYIPTTLNVLWPNLCMAIPFFIGFVTLFKKYFTNLRIQNRNDEAERQFKETMIRVKYFKEIWDFVYYCSRDGTYFNFKNGQPVTKETIEQIKPFLSKKEY